MKPHFVGLKKKMNSYRTASISNYPMRNFNDILFNLLIVALAKSRTIEYKNSLSEQEAVRCLLNVSTLFQFFSPSH